MRKGFTLVELLVVIAIIGVLSTVGIISYNSIKEKALKQALISNARVLMEQDLYKTYGTYDLIPSLESDKIGVDEENKEFYFNGFYDSLTNNYFCIYDSKVCTFNLNSNEWNISDYTESLSNEINSYKLRALNKRLRVGYSNKIEPTIGISDCQHDNVKVFDILGTKCLLCNDCGEYGVNLNSYTTTAPKTSSTGIQRYDYIKDGSSKTFNRTIPKVKTADWFWAFCNDKDSDGMPEFDSFEYINFTTVKYQYLYTKSDFPDYPEYDPSMYNAPTDDEWNQLYEDWENSYNLLYNELLNLENESPEYIAKQQEIESNDQYYTNLEEEYTSKDEAGYQLYLADVASYEEQKGVKVGKQINPNKTRIITEEQKLYYFLHVPFDYNPNKSYPVLVFYPGSGGTLFSFYKSRTTSENALVEGDFYYGKYRQTESSLFDLPYTIASSTAMDKNGNWKDGQLTIRDGSWCGAFFVNWYNQVKNPGEGRDKYDCFVLFLQPADSTWWSSSTFIAMTNQVNVEEIEGAFKITKEMVGDTTSYSGYSRPTYDSSYTSAAPDAQLVCSLIDEMACVYNIDLKRQYVSGGSLGGAFTMDVINHYYDRFACGIPVVAATADITEATAERIVKAGMNIWAISGDGDNNCNKYFSKLFSDRLNAKKEQLGIVDNYTYQFSFFPGGHVCSYIGSTLRTATQGVSITYANQVLDFMFNSTK